MYNYLFINVQFKTSVSFGIFLFQLKKYSMSSLTFAIDIN